MKNSEFVAEAMKRIPKIEDVIDTTLHIISKDGWCVMITKCNSFTTNAEFHIQYKQSKRQKAFHLWGYKLKTSTDWVIGKPSRY